MQGNEILILILAITVINLIIYIRIVSFVLDRGEKFNLFKIDLMFPYISKYKKLTREETGFTGNLYKWWIITINLELLLVIIFIIIKVT